MIAKNNPYNTERVATLLPYDPRWIGESWEGIEQRLHELGGRGCVVGPHGSGKTTFLESFAHRLRDRGEEVVTLFVNRQQRRIPFDFYERLSADSVVLFDGAEQLGGFALGRFMKRCSDVRAIVTTAHQPSRVPTLLQAKVTPELLARCMRRLDPAGDNGVAELLFERHAGNLRHALLECYDLSATNGVGVPSQPC